jgi:hypothetical protein
MIADWFKPADPKDPATSSNAAVGSGNAADADARRKAHAAKLREQEPEINRELSPEEARDRRSSAMRRKLAASAGSGAGHGHPDRSVTFEGLFRPLNALLMTEQHSDFHDGIALNLSRQIHNSMVQTKMSVGSPQAAGWEITLQANGFSDVNAVTYTTAGRMSLMHQRMFKSGALAVLQFMAQPTPAGPQGNFFGMLQWPWMRNGSSQISYLKSQHVNLSHAAKIVRGTTVGAQLTYDMMTKATSVTYGACIQRKNVSWFGKWTPDKSEWSIATTRFDWELDTEVFAQLEMANRKGQSGGEDLMSMVSVGMKKPFIGGAVVNACLQGFSRLKATLELPFGGDREGFNRVTLKYCVQYDAVKGAAKQGISLSM